jgi:hypothetical protein
LTLDFLLAPAASAFPRQGFGLFRYHPRHRKMEKVDTWARFHVQPERAPDLAAARRQEQETSRQQRLDDRCRYRQGRLLL